MSSPAVRNGVADRGLFHTLPAMSTKVFGRAFFKKLAGRGQSPRRSPQRAKLPPAFRKRGKRGLGGRNPEGGVFPHSPIFCTAEYKNAKCKSISITPRFSHSQRIFSGKPHKVSKVSRRIPGGGSVLHPCCIIAASMSYRETPRRC